MARFYVKSFNNSWLLMHDGKVVRGGASFIELFRMAIKENYYYWTFKHPEEAKTWPPR